jgi:hypothetical protein
MGNTNNSNHPWVSPGPHVLIVAFLGPVVGLAPLGLVAWGVLAPLLSPNAPSVVFLVCWGVGLGAVAGSWWIESLHARVDAWATQLREKYPKAKDGEHDSPLRLPWMPSLLGAFERLIYILLLAFNVESGATFIGVWVALKMAGGWQLMKPGTPVGRATFVVGLLGNAMSVLYGIGAGAAIRELLKTPCAA